MKYDVTIGIPVYNVEKYIRMAMDSALAQTYHSIEFLILDDCGTDSSMHIIREYQKMHSRGKDIRIVRQPRNMGIGEARNLIVHEASGRYLYFMDGDDMIAPNTIQLLYEHARRYNAQLVYGSYERIENFDGETKREQVCYPAMQFLEADEFATYVYRQYDGIQAMIWNILIDIRVYRENGLRYLPINYWEDFVFTMDLPTYVTRVVLLPDVTYSYFCRYGSLSNFQKRDHIDKAEIEKTIDAMNFLKGNSLRIKEKTYFPCRMYKVMMTDFYIVCSILRNKDIISPSFSNMEIREVLNNPLSFTDVLSFRHKRLENFLLFLLGKLRPLLMVYISYMLGKLKKIV